MAYSRSSPSKRLTLTTHAHQEELGETAWHRQQESFLDPEASGTNRDWAAPRSSTHDPGGGGVLPENSQMCASHRSPPAQQAHLFDTRVARSISQSTHPVGMMSGRMVLPFPHSAEQVQHPQMVLLFCDTLYVWSPSQCRGSFWPWPPVFDHIGF